MQTKLEVDGMSCSHCENAVKEALLHISGVTDVRVDLISKLVTVTHSENIKIEDLKLAIEEQGYDVLM